MMTARKLAARWVLATAVLRKLVLRLFRMASGAPGPWLGRLARERLAPTPPDAWAYLHETSRCIGCGLCDAVSAEAEPSSWMVAAARQPADSPLGRGAAAGLQQLAAEIAKVCPARLDAGRVARLIEDNARALAAVSERDPGA